MAKHLSETSAPAPVKRRKRTADDISAPVPELSAKTVKLIDAIRGPFNVYVKEFAALTLSRAELAPKFMAAFEAWRTDTTSGSFVAFVRVLDPTVPVDRDGYKAHPAYNAAEYLKRLVNQQAAGERTPVPIGERPVSPLHALARLVATVLPTVDPTGAIWSAFVREMHWTSQQAEKVKVIGAKEGPISLRGRTASILKRVA